MKALCWRLIPFLLFVLVGLFFWRALALNPHHLPSAIVGKSLPDFKLPGLEDGNALTPERMRGHVALLNVWASWCMACTEEQVFLMQLAQQGVVIYGLNYKDTRKDARHWLREWGNPYELIGSDRQGLTAIDLGVYGAPETFLMDKAGVIQYRHAGVMTPEVWRREFLPRIAALENGI